MQLRSKSILIVKYLTEFFLSHFNDIKICPLRLWMTHQKYSHGSNEVLDNHFINYKIKTNRDENITKKAINEKVYIYIIMCPYYMLYYLSLNMLTYIAK